MRGIDATIDDQPTFGNCAAMVEADIRNRLAHDELLFYATHKTFLFKHPILKQDLQESEALRELSELMRGNPEAFLNEVANTTQNIRRYESQLRNGKFKSEAEKKSWENNLARAKMRQKISAAIISKS
jgi:hypothetical protein